MLRRAVSLAYYSASLEERCIGNLRYAPCRHRGCVANFHDDVWEDQLSPEERGDDEDIELMSLSETASLMSAGSVA
jgi:hypothetical protein